MNKLFLLLSLLLCNGCSPIYIDFLSQENKEKRVELHHSKTGVTLNFQFSQAHLFNNVVDNRFLITISNRSSNSLYLRSSDWICIKTLRNTVYSSSFFEEIQKIGYPLEVAANDSINISISYKSELFRSKIKHYVDVLSDEELKVFFKIDVNDLEYAVKDSILLVPDLEKFEKNI